MPQYIRLKEKCLRVDGASRSAIYDLYSGRVYSINPSAKKILERTGKSDAPIRNSRFIKQLKELDLIDISEVPFEHNGNPQLLQPFPWLTFFWLEITSRCNLRCLHCYGDCFAGKQQNSELSVEDWKRVIDEGRGLNCGSLQFIGGEPLLHTGLFDLITYARKKNYTFIEIFSNLTLYQKDFVSFLKEQGVHIATTLYSSNPETHDRITQSRGSQKKTVEAILHLRENEVPLRVAIITMRQNQDDLKETVQFLKELGVDFKMPDPVRPTGRGCSREVIPQNLPREFSGEMDCPNFFTDEYSFRFNQQYNNCWAGKMAITSEGKAIPCIFARDQVIGDVMRQGLKEIIDHGELHRLWRITKDVVETCRQCEYRYACHDCRPLAYGLRNNLFAKPPRCHYDPMRGKWKKRKFNFLRRGG